MTTKTCFYQVLGIEKTSTQDQIKKAYRKLAVKWHPDKNQNNIEQAKQKFREISQAYQNLSDKEKRKTYDTYGHQGPKFSNNLGQGFSHHTFNFSDAQNIFKHFNQQNPFDDDFFKGFFGNRNKSNKSSSGFASQGFGQSFGKDPFFSNNMGKKGFGGGLFKSHSLFDNNDFFKSPFEGKSSFSSFRSQSFGGDFHNNDLDNHPMLSKSVSTTTKTINGKTITTKKTTFINPDGSKQVTQQIIQNGLSNKKMYSLGPGQSMPQNNARIKY